LELIYEYRCTRNKRMRQARPRRTQPRSADTRERLVEAALALFAARGYEGATTRAIAEGAGVALAALPYHFETKEALWRAAAGRIFERLREQFEARIRGLEGVDLRTRLRLLLRDFVLFAASHPELHRFMLQEGAGRSTRLEWLVETHLRPLFAFVRTQVAEAEALGIVPHGRPEHLFYAMIGAASMPYAVAPEFELLTDRDPAEKALTEQHVDMLLRLFFPEQEERRRGRAPTARPRSARRARS
jgi:AcrR family transcriptional regulator